MKLIYKLVLKAMPPFRLISFPCEIGIRRKVVKNKKEFVKYFNTINKFGVRGVYNSIYGFAIMANKRRPKYTSAKVDKVLFDIDLDDFNYNPFFCYLNMLAIHLFCEDYNIQHVVNFSGNGYHVYIGVDSSYIPDDEKDLYIEEIVNTIIGITGSRVCDSCKIRATGRIIRTVGSYYTKFKKIDENDEDYPLKNEKIRYEKFIEKNGFGDRFCINLSDDDIHGGYMHIYRKALNGNFNYRVMGDKRIILNVIDVKKKQLKTKYYEQMQEGYVVNVKGKDMTDVYDLLDAYGVFRDDIPPCMKILMMNDDMRYRERFLFVVYLIKLDLSKKEIKEILRKVLSKRKFNHAYIEEDDHPGYIYDNRERFGKDYDINCGSVKALGYCSKYCQKFDLFPF